MGPLLRAALFDFGEEGQRLFMVLHHLIVDGVSWRILLADLESAYRAFAAVPLSPARGEGWGEGNGIKPSGIEPVLLPVGTSLARWGARLAEEARSASAAEELGFWLSRVRD